MSALSCRMRSDALRASISPTEQH
uniref:Uncharacterized protein n=1 Tax=Anguilla anguilla TaxID=7936 RepID=A0A0E9P9R8_ANGAN